jgi:hypothetical protein
MPAREFLFVSVQEDYLDEPKIDRNTTKAATRFRPTENKISLLSLTEAINELDSIERL